MLNLRTTRNFLPGARNYGRHYFLFRKAIPPRGSPKDARGLTSSGTGSSQKDLSQSQGRSGPSIAADNPSPRNAANTANRLSQTTRGLGRNPFPVNREKTNQLFPAAFQLDSTNQNLSRQRTTNRPSGAFPQSRSASTGYVETVAVEKAEEEKSKKKDDTSTGPNFDVTFDNFHMAFSNKSSWELIRGLSMLWACSFDFVSGNSLKLMSLCEKVLGKRASDWVMKKTAYGQFVAGETTEEIRGVVSRLQEVNVGPLLAAPMEDDINSSHPDADRKFDDNLDVILKSMTLAHQLDPVYPMIQLKLTALMPGDLCALLTKRCPDPSSSPWVIEDVAAALVGKSLDIDRTFGKGIPDSMKHHLEQGIRRVATVCQAAVSDEVIVMVDAEYTYLNPALGLFALAMMLVCNEPSQRPPLVFHTYQNYLTSTRETLEKDLQFTDNHGIGFGAKMVRGAYMVRERLLSLRSGYSDPIHDTYDATSAAYDAAVTSLLNKIASRPRGYRMIVASHNEQSALSAVKRMQQLGIDPNGGDVFFGQLLGMADHISCSLGVCGFLARKSLPYGPVSETLPYLSRRAQENKVVIAGARRERELLKLELRQRLGL